MASTAASTGGFGDLIFYTTNGTGYTKADWPADESDADGEVDRIRERLTALLGSSAPKGSGDEMEKNNEVIKALLANQERLVAEIAALKKEKEKAWSEVLAAAQQEILFLKDELRANEQTAMRWEQEVQHCRRAHQS